MKNRFYAVLSRMKYIYRWGLMRNTRPENLSEHSLEVAQIAHALALLRNSRFGGRVDPNAAAVAAMYHDSSEILTGDLPTPIKYRNNEIKTAYKQIEPTAEEQLTALLPEDFKEAFIAVYHPDAEIEQLVKAADKLSALIKCIEEQNSGNREFVSAEKSVRQAIENLRCPEADLFLKEFIPAFSMTLDQQSTD